MKIESRLGFGSNPWMKMSQDLFLSYSSPSFRCVKPCNTNLSLSLCSGSVHVSSSTLLSVFSPPTFWLMSFKYHAILPFSHLWSSVSFGCFPQLAPPAHVPPNRTTPLKFTCSPTALLPLPLGLIISLQLLRGELEQIRRENQAVFNRALALTRKLGFPDVILPGKKLGSSMCGWVQREGVETRGQMAWRN